MWTTRWQSATCGLLAEKQWENYGNWSHHVYNLFKTWKISKNQFIVTWRAKDDLKLKISLAQLSDQGEYQCVAENLAGKSVGSINISITSEFFNWILISHCKVVIFYFKKDMPKITYQPSSKDVVEGSSVELKCGYEGDPFPATVIEWRKSGVVLTVCFIHYTYYNIFWKKCIFLSLVQFPRSPPENLCPKRPGHATFWSRDQKRHGPLWVCGENGRSRPPGFKTRRFDRDWETEIRPETGWPETGVWFKCPDSLCGRWAFCAQNQVVSGEWRWFHWFFRYDFTYIYDDW